MPEDERRQSDVFYMQKALECAEGSLYISRPNPRVGCVIVYEGKIVGEGFTQVAGQAHAEVQAIQQALSQGFQLFADATFYVTLEPCSHYGKTPPCVESIIKLAPKRVVIAMRDPNPLVAGKGIQRLTDAGISVTVGVCAEQALALNIGFVHRMLYDQPWVRLKVASSIDGRTALKNGVSQWITGSAARNDSHFLRARSCAIVTGCGTVVADNPQFTVRSLETPCPPAIYIVDSHLRTPADALLLNNPEVHILTTEKGAVNKQALEERGVHIHILPEGQDGRVTLASCMQLLQEQQVNEIHLEAGAVLSGALYQQGYLHEIVHYMAPVLLGKGRGMLDFPELSVLPKERIFSVRDVRVIASQEDTMQTDDIRINYIQQSLWEACLRAVEV